jgi:aldehyde:ferredoxin oxidoreductase
MTSDDIGDPPGVSNFGGPFGAYLKYAGFDVLDAKKEA